MVGGAYTTHTLNGMCHNHYSARGSGAHDAPHAGIEEGGGGGGGRRAAERPPARSPLARAVDEEAEAVRVRVSRPVKL